MNSFTIGKRCDRCVHFVFDCILFFCRNQVRQMFIHGYENYLNHASEFDELQPLSCRGMNTWGSFSLTLIDSLDTLAVFGNHTEFKRVANFIIENLHFDQNINVSVFETNIRVVGGLLSAHLLSHRTGFAGKEWPCDGPLLRMAEDVARRLLPAFETKTGMPYGTVNLKYGVPKDETPITCTAGVGTFILEFATLSRLTGDEIFERKALQALEALHKTRSALSLLGNHINTTDGKWTALDSSIGAGVDSFFEYLVKGSMLLRKPQLMEMFKEYHAAINKHMLREDWFMVVHMTSGLATMPIFQSLEAFWPGLLTLIGEIENAQKSLYNYHQVWKQYGFIPEFYDIPNYEVKRNGYPLRPEFVESLYYLYKATKDPYLLHIGVDVIESIEHSARTTCGYATVKDVKKHTIEDRMESFFLAETLKYLFLLFDESNFLSNDGSKGTVIHNSQGTCIVDSGSYVFNTEAHPFDIAAVHCCSASKKMEDKTIDDLRTNLDLYSFLDLNSDHHIKPKKKIKKSQVPNLEIKSSPFLINEFDAIDKFVSEIDDDLLKLQTSSVEPSSTDVAIDKHTISSTEQLSLPNFSSSLLNESLSVSEVPISTAHNSEIVLSLTAEKSQVLSYTETSTQLNKSPSSAIEKTAFTDELFKIFDHIFTSFDKNETINSDNHSVELSPNFELLLCPSTHFMQNFAHFGQMYTVKGQ
ncbi:ER degradation-enhancing alpha-mannosidase-like protein 2 [Dinothrombium tinctorium]|uniref:alpha-1,2-Mannosidase n=1 Tax=Dinothrombium tinctorium TaxID=1965070 RepID=A0A3S3Q7R6_9ACAR|nr:ER degradation-enhancing alpha-mannosidase-like protein 2 [Dinothrombium tinctorium]RWS04909.1 ER degradation-enhancing alpha-mannosidase-like protein 2 [Dinothrombium tinctorium]RWS06075.1 ER degradation-enhancing alpha-mannosidase-like protein 2 [Dinothrombium tinctorium]